MNKIFWFHYPGMGYAANWYTASSKKEARQQIREWLGLKRLPNGFAIWEKTN